MRVGRDTEIRKLPPAALFGLVAELEQASAWKQVMARVQRSPMETSQCPIKYTSQHIMMVMNAGERQGKKCAEIFLEEWGCSGRKRPTIADLLSLLVEAQLYKAADYVAEELLEEPRPRRPDFGPAAEVLIPLELLSSVEPTAPLISNLVSVADVVRCNEVAPLEIDPRVPPAPDNLIMNDRSHAGVSVAEESIRLAQHLETVPIDHITDCIPQHIAYKELQAITKNFDSNPVGENDGRLLGKGGFGSVHLAMKDNYLTAVKRLHTGNFNFDRLFQNEVDTLLRVAHPNLLRMIAYSNDGPEKCFVYEYMSQGNLEERLACQGKWDIPLSYLVRINIALGTSKGLQHLHDYCDPPLVHRDVKSANILLDKDLSPKLGDFGLVHLGASTDGNGSASALHTSTVIGTTVYMAPETIRGELSVKSDVYSFGVVLLELLTGLSPDGSYGEGVPLDLYVTGICENSISSLLDLRAGNWTSINKSNLSELLFSLAKDCLEDVDERPFITPVVVRVESMLEL